MQLRQQTERGYKCVDGCMCEGEALPVLPALGGL